MKRRSLYHACLLIVCLLLLSFSCRGGRRDEVLFNYGKILKKEFESNVGRVVPVTIEQSTEIDGVFSEKGLLFFFSSDRDRGNFDIYLRTLSGITTVRLTAHPSKDTAPAISPDGRRLAYVSERDDPEGDIFVVALNPGELLKKAEESAEDIPPLDRQAKNFTQVQDPATKVLRIAKDASPVWSPDGGKIAFSSTRGGEENVWIMDRDGGNITQLTKKGGMYPRFSPDGEKLVYISYRDTGAGGDVYTLDLKSGQEKRVTSTPAIELYPTFAASTDEIVYTLIDRDTNGDGKVDLKDNSVLYYKNLRSGAEYPLTAYSQSSFEPRFSSALKAVNVNYFNVLVYANQIGQNINVNIIPTGGIIPKASGAEQQYELAERYLKEYDDRERYLMGLERVYHFFGKDRSAQSVIFVSKALIDAAGAYQRAGKDADARRIHGMLSSMSADPADYSQISSRFLASTLAGKSGASILEENIGRLAAQGDKSGFVPYLMEDLGDEFADRGRADDAVRTYREILQKHPKYGRALNVEYKIGAATYRSIAGEVPASYLKVLNSTNVNLAIDATAGILSAFESEKSAQKRISAAQRALARYGAKSGEKITGVMMYLAGDGYFSIGDRKKASEYLDNALKNVYRSNVIFYRANKLLGDIAEREGRLDDMEKYYFESVTNYILRWKQADLPQVITRLIRFYEERGGELQAKGQHKQASAFYKKYVDVISFVHQLRQYEDIYGRYGSRSHLLYVDSVVNVARDPARELERLEKEYRKTVDAARMNFDKARLYGLAYIHARTALTRDRGEGSSISSANLEGLLENFRLSVEQLDWALFMDDTYTDAYVLKGWIAQYVDLKRRELAGRSEGTFRRYFPRYLWEANVPFYERALAANDEREYPEIEGNIHLNLANTYFLLTNYQAALRHYEKAAEFKRNFGSQMEEALFRFHYGFCFWQDNQLDRARAEMRRALLIYVALGQVHGVRNYREQIHNLYRYFALFDRVENNFTGAIGWYNRILRFADENALVIDRARYLQEIASCYQGLGDSAQAISFLDRADSILAKASDSEPTYRLRMRLLGIGPIPLINLGPDVAVIGDNRIFTELGVSNKKLLSLAIREEISFARGDYEKAIEYQKARLDLWKERSTRVNQEGVVRELNNIGYSYFRLMDFARAGEYFKKAWDYAADPGVNDLGGIFTSIMNMVNLTAMLMERRDPHAAVSERDITALIGRIADYRDNYEKNRFKSELEGLKADAKAKKREVTEEETDALRRRIAESAKAIYYTTDIASAVMQYSYAENFLAEAKPAGKSNGAMDVYRRNEKAVSTYAGALARFESALSFADSQPSKRLLVKLLLNMAACQGRIGMIDEAYDSLARAEGLVKKYQYADLDWVVYGKIGEFLLAEGRRVEGPGYLALAEGYFQKAFDSLESFPALCAENRHQAERLYGSYIAHLMSRSQWERALAYYEKKYATGRVMTAALSQLSLRDERERALYLRHRELLQKIDRKGQAITGMLESGDADDSDRVKAARGELAALKASYAQLRREFRPADALLASHLFIADTRIAVPSGVTAYRFERTDGGIGVWKVGRATTYSTLASSAGEGKAVREFLKKESAGSGAIQVVLNRFVASTLMKEDLTKDCPPFTLVPSMERCRYYPALAAATVASAGFTDPALARSLRGRDELKGLRIVESTAQVPPADVSIFVDSGSGGPSVSAPGLFAGKDGVRVLMRRMAPLDADRINQFGEAALYAGIRSFVVFDDMGKSEMTKLLASARRGLLDVSAASADAGRAVIVMGSR